MSAGRIVYLMVEDKARELASRLVIGAALVRRGVTAVVGQQWLLSENLAYLPPGVVLFKGLNRIQARNMDLARRHGHVPVGIDEEGVVLCDAEQLLLDADETARPERVFVSTDWHAEVFRRWFGDRVVTTGNPRFDILKHPAMFADEVARLRERYGEFALICSNTAGANSGFGSRDAYLQVLRDIGWVRDERGMIFYAEHLEHDGGNQREVARMVDLLDDVPIVFRPHPSERIETWQDLYRDRRNVEVILEGSHLPWILASKVMVHTGCTTGLEADVMGQPSIALRTGHPVDQRFVSNRINPAMGAAAAAAMVRAAMAAERTSRPPSAEDQAHRRVAEHLAELCGEVSAVPHLKYRGMTTNAMQSRKALFTPDELIGLAKRLRGRFGWPDLKLRQLGDGVFAMEPPTDGDAG